LLLGQGRQELRKTVHDRPTNARYDDSRRRTTGEP
jgi:hypothetical protein